MLLCYFYYVIRLFILYKFISLCIVTMLGKIKEKLKGTFKSKKSIMLIFVAAILLMVGLYYIKTYVYPKLNPKYVANKEFVSKDKGKDVQQKKIEIAELFYFYTDWCPYCKTAKAEWNAVKEQFSGKKINNYELRFREINCEDSMNADLVKDNKIDGYPTIKMRLADGKTVEYDAKPQRDTLELFINTVLK